MLYNKAITAAVGAIIVWVTTYAPASYTHWLPLIVGVLTAVGVYQVPNIDASVPPPQG